MAVVGKVFFEAIHLRVLPDTYRGERFQVAFLVALCRKVLVRKCSVKAGVRCYVASQRKCGRLRVSSVCGVPVRYIGMGW